MDLNLIDMLRAGVHFGHRQSRRHPKMEANVFTTRSGISIINLERTRTALVSAANFLRELTAGGGTVLFVGTKKQVRDLTQAAAQTVAMPYVIVRWIGGLFTNFSQVRKLIQKLQELKEQRASGDWAKYTKKEQLEFQEEMDRLDKLVGGLGALEKLPTALFVADAKQDRTAVREARAMNIPVVAICDTNVNPDHITYPIPGNDDATKSVSLITDYLAAAIKEGRVRQEQKMVEQVRDAAAADETSAVPVADVT